MKNASFRIILEDLKISFKFAVKNIISYILAIFGVLIISGILLVLVAAVVFTSIFFVLGGFEGLVAFFTSLAANFETGFTNLFVGAILIVLPLLAPFFVAIGALFGMGREIVESEGTSAEGVFTWYKKRFFSLAGGGIILFLVVLGPLILSLLVGIAIYGYDFFGYSIMAGGYNLVNTVIGILLTAWFAVSLGMLSMLFPAIIDGYSVIEATKKSIRMSIMYFDRVFGVWIGFLLVLGACILPLIATPFLIGISEPAAIALGSVAVPLILILIFVFVPALSIGLTRIYMILTAEDGYEPVEQDEESGPSFIGGL
jgi:hypothetical protein